MSGIENYSLGRKWGEAYTLLKYFPDDFLTIIDESHVTVPKFVVCIMGIVLVRKLWFVMFRLPSAKENRPQARFDEFEATVDQVIVRVLPW